MTNKDQPFELYTEADSPTGVDDSLLLKQLRKTPQERLEWAERMQEEIAALRTRFRKVDEGGSRG